MEESSDSEPGGMSSHLLVDFSVVEFLDVFSRFLG